MTLQEFIDLRKALSLSQTEMGRHMGLSLRAIQDVEGGITDLKARHILLAERVALSEAVKQGNPMLAPAAVRREALELARQITG